MRKSLGFLETSVKTREPLAAGQAAILVVIDWWGIAAGEGEPLSWIAEKGSLERR